MRDDRGPDGKIHRRIITCDADGCSSRILLEHVRGDVADDQVSEALRVLGWHRSPHEDPAKDRHHCPWCAR